MLAIGLAKDPANRLSTAGELARAVADALHEKVSDAVRARGQALDVTGAWLR